MFNKLNFKFQQVNGLSLHRIAIHLIREGNRIKTTIFAPIIKKAKATFINAQNRNCN